MHALIYTTHRVHCSDLPSCYIPLYVGNAFVVLSFLAAILAALLSVHNADSSRLVATARRGGGDAESEKCAKRLKIAVASSGSKQRSSTKIRSHGSSDMKLSFGVLAE